MANEESFETVEKKEEVPENVQSVPETAKPAAEALNPKETEPAEAAPAIGPAAGLASKLTAEAAQEEEAEPAEEEKAAEPAEEEKAAEPAEEEKAAESAAESEPAEPEKKEKKPCGLVRFFLDSPNAGLLILKSIILLLIPYAWLFVGGFIFETLLGKYDKAVVVAVIALVLLAASLTLIAVSVVRYVKGKKH